MGSISSLSGSSLESAFLSSSLQALTQSGSTSASSLAGASLTSQTDSSQLSPLVKLLSELQQLQKSDPAEYQDVTKQIAASLQSAAQTDTAAGDTTGASKLTQLAADFTKASTTGDLPDISDLAQAVGHGHHGGHRPPPAASSDDSTSTTDSTSVQTLSQLLTAYLASSSQSSSTDPLSIIQNALSSAGITGTN